ncbi:TetR family transcriptional regulator [Shewanella schlegeliana]|uniref:TetR family transcriptional regulator n=1 Tax=Shewanella schlegeliana TaxID=190308 RepID=A0ABS1SYX0_9GAMM|nr:TetR family transcriptional regulator [Shewanella schlegeliana]MBL4913084.1 TetR family transcriptional regulator [Shewanella schlegeliana]MCL1111098.1 TetR family transcriptional regulator [Shewanella schlegeliana]GIU28314.1 TetR family transcriptional regulator [Shewanella schlegeliana]
MLVPLTYVGRQSNRSDGQARRIEILEATLRLIVKEGIRGVRHRAVASEANVPLSSTTYYFDDIKDLISDSLTYFAEKTLWMNKTLEQKSYALVESLRLEQKTADETQMKTFIVENLSQFICEHIKEQLAHRDDRVLEMAFHEEALRNPQLAAAISALDESFLGSIKQFFAAMGSTTANADAHQVLAIIKLLESQYLLRDVFDDKEIFAIVRSTVSHIVKAI